MKNIKIAIVFIFFFVVPFSKNANAQEHREFLLLPSQAQPQKESDNGYILQKVGGNSYVVISGFVQASFVVTSAGVVIIDVPPSLSEKLLLAIKSVTTQKVTHVILTHDHFDHIGGVTKFKGAKLIAHEETSKLLRLYPDSLRPVPSISFKGEKHILKVGGIEIQLLYPGPNHESGNIIVFVPQDKIAIMTDLVMPGWVPYRGWGNADNIPGIFKAYKELLKLDFDTYVGGHVYRTGTRKDVEDSREYLIDLWNETNNAIGTVKFNAASEPANVWAAQTVWFNDVANVVTEKLISKWKTKLGGTDTFTHDTVVSTVISIYTDAPKIPEEYLE